MARFYVGQRVRIVGCNNDLMHNHVGKEGKIIGKPPMYPNSWYVDSAMDNGIGGRCSWNEDHLQPIIDPGREVIAWSECVWKPEHLRTEA